MSEEVSVICGTCLGILPIVNGHYAKHFDYECVYVLTQRVKKAEAENARLLEVERKAIEQSEYIQTHGLTEYELHLLKAENARLQTVVDKQASVLRFKDDALDSFAEFYRQCVIAVGQADTDTDLADVGMGTAMDELILSYIEQGNQLVGVRAENARLREALETIAGMRFDTESGGWMCNIAEKALGGYE